MCKLQSGGGQTHSWTLVMLTCAVRQRLRRNCGREPTKVFKQRLHKTGAVAVQAAVHVDVRAGDWSEETGQKSVKLGWQTLKMEIVDN